VVAVKAMIGLLGELFVFFWQRKLWWLTPMVVILLIFAILIVLGNVAGIGPFIYTLF
jgi:hypothetical protein